MAVEMLSVMDMHICMWRKGNFSRASFSFFLILSQKISFLWLAFRLCVPSLLEGFVGSPVLIALMDGGQHHKSRSQKWPVGKWNRFSFMWLLAVSFNKWMLCSKSPSELGLIASLLCGRHWKCLSQGLWGWRASLFTVCYRVFAWNQPDWSSKQGPGPAACFPACLCSREKQKEAEISRDTLAETFAISMSSKAAEKLLVREGVYVLQASSLVLILIVGISLLTYGSLFGNTSMGKGVCAPPDFFMGYIPRSGWLFCFLNPISTFAALAWLSPTVRGHLCLPELLLSVQRRWQGRREVPCPTSCLWSWSEDCGAGYVLAVCCTFTMRGFFASLEMKENSCFCRSPTNYYVTGDFLLESCMPVCSMYTCLSETPRSLDVREALQKHRVWSLILGSVRHSRCCLECFPLIQLVYWGVRCYFPYW